MPPKGWSKNQQDNLDKKKQAADVANKTITKTTIEEIKADTKEKPFEEVPVKAMNTGSKESRDRLPKVTVSTYNKDGQLVTKQYYCLNIRIDENINTTLSGGQPTQRKDVMHIGLDADVVEVVN